MAVQILADLVTIQSRTPSDPLRGPPPSKREAFGEQMRLIGSLPEVCAAMPLGGAGWPIGQTEGVLLGRTEQLRQENRWRPRGRRYNTNDFDVFAAAAIPVPCSLFPVPSSPR